MTNRTDGVWSYERVATVQLDPEWPAVEVGVHRHGPDARVVLAQDGGLDYVATATMARQLADALTRAVHRTRAEPTGSAT
jgi:hypothetical protein